MIHGHYSDYDEVKLSDGRQGIITRSFGHVVMSGRGPDVNHGPRYEVLLNGKKIFHDGRFEWLGTEYIIVEEMSDGSLQGIAN